MISLRMVARGACYAPLFLLLGCGRAQSDPHSEQVAIPPDFEPGLVANLKCPENFSPLRLATIAELDKINQRIRSGKLRTWGQEPVSEIVAGVLIRQDGKIAYRVDKAVPDLRIENALVLDDKVGLPDPSKNRK